VTGARTYGQFCGLAAGLDLLGERWTLLVIREMLHGPVRFNDILANLPGVGPNLLAARLRRLTEAGVVEMHRTSSDGRGREYGLTTRGRRLREPILMLARWGLEELISAEDPHGATRASWSVLAVEGMIFDAAAPTVTETYDFRIGEEVFHIDVDGGRAVVRRGPSTQPALILTTDIETFIEIGARLLSPFVAAASGRLTMEGEPAALVRCTGLMGLDRNAAAAAAAAAF
jgi:DNA-binding HxlR family transcriptional regulator